MLRKSLVALVVAGFFADTTLGGASLWAGATLDNNVYELNPADGQILSSIPGPGNWTDGVSWQTDGSSLWIADSSNNSTIYQINPSGDVITSFFTPIDAEGIEYLSDGTIAVAAGQGDQVVFFDSSGNQTGAFPTGHGSFGIDSHLGTLWVLDRDGTIYEYDTLGNLQTVIDTAVTGTALGLAYNWQTGGFFVSATGSTIYELNSAGAIINTYAGPDSFTEALDYFPLGCFQKISEEVICHADGTTFTVNVEGINACTGGTMMVTFTGSGGAVGEEMCFTVLVNDPGFCCSTEICVTIPDCSPPAQVLPCPWDCAFPANGTIDVMDFFEVLAQWSLVGTSCDFKGNGVDVVDFFGVLANWGPCP